MNQIRKQAVVIVALGSMSIAQADLITFALDGIVSGVPSELGSQFATNDVLTGSFTFESSTVDTTASPTLGNYDAILSLSFAIDGYEGSSTSGRILVFNDDPFPSIPDLYQVEAFFPDLEAPLIDGFQLTNFQLTFADSTGTALTSDSLPLDPEGLVGFANPPSLTLFFIDSQNPGGTIGLGVRNLSLTTVSVPEPSTLALFGIGLLGLAFARRRAS